MPRRRRRKIRSRPNHTQFGPEGGPNPPEVLLKVEEFEALRLKDLDDLSQEEAAEKMNVSQPTFCRILAPARKKVADALINGKSLRIKGGDYKVGPK